MKDSIEERDNIMLPSSKERLDIAASLHYHHMQRYYDMIRMSFGETCPSYRWSFDIVLINEM